MATAARITFASFEIDVESSELWKDGAKVKLAPQPVRLLALLAAQPGALMTRKAIREKLWGSGTTVDFESGLNVCIRETRIALGDDAQHPRYIETLPRRGYRFIAAVRSTPEPAASAPSNDRTGIEAYENYVKGRENLAKLGKESLELAREYFERSVTLDPKYAMAHSGLGATYAMRTINRRDPADLEQARNHLTRALAIDSELGEPYPWLCYVNLRLSQLDDAIGMGLRGVQLLPNLAQAHYFLGVAYYAASERDVSNYRCAVDHLMEAMRVGPSWHASWFVASCVALVQGDYAEAERFAEHLLEMNRTPGGVPFIGAELVLASLRLRNGRTCDARQILSAFLAKLAASDHMYGNSMSAAAQATLGDIELRAGRQMEAETAYRSAWQSVQEHNRFVAHQRLAARVQSGLAAMYATAGRRERAEELFAKAAEMTERSHASEHNAAASNLADLYWSLAVAAIRLGNRQDSLMMLERAVIAGWLDATWLEKDPEFIDLRNEPRFSALAEKIQNSQRVRFSDLL